MHCRVLLFAHLAEQVGQRELTLALDDRATVRDALDALADRHAAVAAARSTLATAVDDAYCSQETPLRDGCTLALIPPVSGG